MPQAMKIPDAKAAVDKEWKKLETISAWQLEKILKQTGGYSRSTKRQKESPLCYIDGRMPPQKRGVRTKFTEAQKQSRAPGDVAKDDSGASAVLTEQGLSASQKTAAKIMDVKTRLQGCDGQEAGAVSASSRVQLEDAPRLLKSPKSECPDFWIRLPRHKWPKS